MRAHGSVRTKHTRTHKTHTNTYTVHGTRAGAAETDERRTSRKNGEKAGPDNQKKTEKNEGAVFQKTAGRAAETDERRATRKNGEKGGTDNRIPGKEAERSFKKRAARGGDGYGAGDPEKRGKSEGGKSATGEKSEADF